MKALHVKHYISRPLPKNPSLRRSGIRLFLSAFRLTSMLIVIIDAKIIIKQFLPTITYYRRCLMQCFTIGGLAERGC